MVENANTQNTEDSLNKAWGSNFRVNGVEYAASLFWQSLQNQNAPLPEVIESSQGVLEGADLYCIKKGKTPQFGICVSADGYRSNENVAAPNVATALADQPSFVAVFKVDGGWWYICVRDEVILANGDMLYLSEDDAKKQFMNMLMVPDWHLKIAPPEWGLEDTIYPNLSDILERGSRIKLQKIASKTQTFYIIAGLVGLVSLYFLYKFLMFIFAPTPAPVVAPIQPKAVQKPTPPPEPKPWENIPSPHEIMQNCHQSTLSLVKILPPGWTISPISCSMSGINAAWTRQFGRIYTVDKALNDSGLNFSARSISEDGNRIMVALSMDKINTENSEPNKNLVEIRNTMNNLFQSIDQTVSMSDYTYTSPQKKVYKAIKFKFSSGYNPKIWSNLLTDFSGLEINSIQYDPASGVWSYEGAIYAL